MESILAHFLFTLISSYFTLLLISLLSSSYTLASFFPREAIPTKSGYLSVHPTSGSSLFYAFYEAQQPTSSLSETPLLIWLEGGPGCSSMLANFHGVGPWRINQNITLELIPNEGAWNRVFGLVFLDNPIGTGFSIASSPMEIPKDQTTVAKHLFVAIKSFLALHPSFKTRPIYITGESYAGKYIPAIAHYIAKRKNPQLEQDERINLAGIAIGNGLVDPVVQVTTHAINAHFVGLINDMQKSWLESAQGEVVKLVTQKRWYEATNARNKVLSMLENMTGLATLFDMERKAPYQELDLVDKFLSNVEANVVLGVNNSFGFKECSNRVANALHEDMMKSVRHKVEYLLSMKRYKVLLYEGQRDLKDGVISVEAWMKELKWEGIREFKSLERQVWRVKGEVAGYVQKQGMLAHVSVLRAGHFVAIDQSVNAQAMIEDWVLERGLFANDAIAIL